MIYHFGFFQYKQNKHFLSWLLPLVRAREDLIHSSPHSILPCSDAFLLRSELGMVVGAVLLGSRTTSLLWKGLRLSSRIFAHGAKSLGAQVLCLLINN